MEDAKPYTFNYTNAEPPFKLKVKYREGINVMWKEHEVCVRVTQGRNGQLTPPMRVKVIPEDGKNGLEFLMNVVAS